LICIRKVAGLVALARERNPHARVACICPTDAATLGALRLAVDQGVARPLAVGPEHATVAAAQRVGVSLEGFELEDAPDEAAAARAATQRVHDGDAAVLMKGAVPTKTVLRAVLDRHIGLRRGHMLSQVAVFDAPSLERPVLLTDCGVNIRPNLSQKLEIIRNAGEVARRLGIKRPRVALLAAIEHVILPAMPATLDAKLIERMSEGGALGDMVVQGPLALDDAVSPDVARAKALPGPVSGQANVLVVPELETGNVLYKTLTCFAGLEGASIVWGATAPVVLISRADTARVKFLSMAFAVAMVGARSAQGVPA